eukprot:scaffold672_cov268-Pinguiococcus_pyrenoidosus.AAC.17
MSREKTASLLSKAFCSSDLAGRLFVGIGAATPSSPSRLRAMDDAAALSSSTGPRGICGGP